MKKIFKCLIFFMMILLLNGCNLSESSSPNSSETSTNRKELNFESEVVIINASEEEHQESSLEETVKNVYDSVVVIKAQNSYQASSGSGVLIGHSDKYSYVITCHHVIENMTSFDVVLNNGDSYIASLVGGDSVTDIAVLAIEATDLNYATFIADSHSLNLAQQVFAIGNPLGTLGGTVTVGYISSLNRMIEMNDGSLKDLIQTDAAINSGNSGGGLFNLYGELIGIVNAKYSATGVEGLGFAIPANTARSIATGLIEKGYVEGRFNIGITISDGYYRTGGWFSTSYKVVYISNVDANSSANGLLKKNDIINAVTVIFGSGRDSKSLTQFTEAQEVINFLNNADLAIGDKVIFNITRDSYDATPIDVEVPIVQYIY